ncbi:MAG: saccharopine dehydrogenase NADP-binding domain-containing protein [Burkholderiaceae bacterium]|nr:saccharopine dehydrogenase NADP-binding domain-containing protein [Burkholderiaceae bacterium]
MIYGANGYSGRLIAAEALRLGLRPVLAGRGAAVEELGAELGLPVRRFDLGDGAATLAALTDMELVLNCAGPFSRTAAAMMAACLQVKAHYLDITGEFPVFEHARSLHATAVEKGIVLCPGVGFDVIPTDCLAVALKRALPDATSLTLGFDTSSSLSPGTTKTVIENLHEGGKIRRGGELVTVPNAWRVRKINFGFGSKWAMTLPWGDISTAYASTGIPNIKVYVAVPRKTARLSRWTDWARGIYRQAWLQRFLLRWVDKHVQGPDAEQRAMLRTAVWGKVRNAEGVTRNARVETASVYALTVYGAVAMVRWLKEHEVAGGYYTPAMLAGPELVERLPGSSEIRIV